MTAVEARALRSSATYGNLAYDLDRELRERTLRHAGEVTFPEAVPEPKVRSVSRVQVRERQRVSPAAVLGFAGVILLAVLVLMSYAQLTELSTSVVKLRSQLSDLEAQNVVLTAQYEQVYDLASVRAAAESAGMSKPSSSQVSYFDLSQGDSAVVYQEKKPGVLSSLLSALNHGVYAVVEYFN